MEENDEIDGDYPLKEGVETVADGAVTLSPSPRTDDIGLLAHRLCGNPPDFTAAPPLVESVRERSGDAPADALAGQIIQLLRNIPADAAESEHEESRRGTLRSLRRGVRKICAPYLFDLTSTCTALARFVAATSKPLAPLETKSATVETIMIRVPQGYGIGDRFRMPDNRPGVIVTPRGTDGRAGVMPVENDGPPAWTPPVTR